MGGWQHPPCSPASPFPKFRALSPVSPDGSSPLVRGSPRPPSPAPPLRPASLLPRLTFPSALVPAAHRKTSPGTTSGTTWRFRKCTCCRSAHPARAVMEGIAWVSWALVVGMGSEADIALQLSLKPRPR